MSPFEPSLYNLVTETSLKWIFVGGKGGVGKTTTSSSLAIQLSKHRPNVLIVSTDPAHNLSDAFGQKFSKHPTLVHGYENLFAMEIDPTVEIPDEMLNMINSREGLMRDSGGLGGLGGIIQDLSLNIPGIDEAMSFAEVMRLVQSMDYSVVVFDTAPTGHTLRFLSFPGLLKNALGKLSEWKNQFGTILRQFTGLLGGGANGFPPIDTLFEKLDSMRVLIDEVNQQFQNAKLTTFVCVCIAEFLSLYETERLIQELSKYRMDVRNIVVNQLLGVGEKESAGSTDREPSFRTSSMLSTPSCVSHRTCATCQARYQMQQKYLKQILELYEDFHIVQCPLLTNEVRGTLSLDLFGQHLMGIPSP